MSVVVTWVAVEVRIRRAFAIRFASGVGMSNVWPRAIVGGAEVIVGRGVPFSRYGGVKISIRCSNVPGMVFFSSSNSGSEPATSDAAVGEQQRLGVVVAPDARVGHRRELVRRRVEGVREVVVRRALAPVVRATRS